MDGYTDSKVDKKAYIIPLIALLLCSTAFVGLAYAYSSSVEISNNQIAGQYYELDYTNGSGVPIDAVISLNNDADFTVHTEIAINGSRTFDAIIEAGSFQRVFYVKMYSDIPNKTFTLSATPDSPSDSVLSQFITGITYTFRDETDAVIDGTAVENGDLVKITATFTIGSNVSLNTIDTAVDITPTHTGVTDKASMIEAINTICSTHKYTVSVTATPND